ncbi:MAG TPA: AAA family ATPase [Lacunisphaera sp.]|nr:AAA family ATPase [Lacunisphaera sp.]
MTSWVDTIRAHYGSDSSRQFILYGNTEDVYPVATAKGLARKETLLVSLSDYLQKELLAEFEVLIVYGAATGIQIVKGKELTSQWTDIARASSCVTHRQAAETLKVLLLFLDHLSAQLKKSISVACIMENAELVVPNDGSRLQQDVSTTAAIVRSWSQPGLNQGFILTTFLITRNLTELNTLVSQNPRAAMVEVPMPGEQEILAELGRDPAYRGALAEFQSDLPGLARRLSGVNLQGLIQTLRLEAYQGRAITGRVLVEMRKKLVERQAGGSQEGKRVVEFLTSEKTLDQLLGQPALVKLFRQDLALLRAGRADLCPMGYLLSAPVGCGKNHLVECLAGEAGIPVVVINNFRDRWVGSTEGNVENIFRLIRALGQCFVFVDEADQTLGKRDSGSDTGSGVDGRVYSMFASFMGDSRNQGKVVWLLASSRPDKIEVDFKRPGRIDTKVPIFPALSAEAGYALLRTLLAGRQVNLPETLPPGLPIPDLLTPGAARALAGQLARELALRATEAGAIDPLAVVAEVLRDYFPPVPLSTIAFQMQLAVNETTDARLIPAAVPVKIAEYLSPKSLNP